MEPVSSRDPRVTGESKDMLPLTLKPEIENVGKLEKVKGLVVLPEIDITFWLKAIPTERPRGVSDIGNITLLSKAADSSRSEPSDTPENVIFVGVCYKT